MDFTLFVKDTVGDVEAARYGPGKGKIPRFRRTGAGRVLGLDEGLRIVRGSNVEEVEIAPGGKKRARYIDLEGLKVQSKKQKKLKTGSRTSIIASGQSFVPLSTSKAKNRQEEEKEDHIYLGHQFAGTNEKEASDQSEEGDSFDDDDTDEDFQSAEEELQERLKQLDSKIRANPSDVTSWLALVDIQEEVVNMAALQDKSGAQRTGTFAKRERSKIQQSIAEVQFSVLDRATRAHPSNAASLPLLMSKLDLAASSTLWDSIRIEKEWRYAIASSSLDWNASVRLWNGFLSWKMSDNNSFVLRETLSTYADAFHTLRGHIFPKKTQEGEVERERTSLHLFEKVVQLMYEAGYVERAHGLLQAQLELTFRRPDELNVNTEEAFQQSCRELEDYWDLDERRIGEAGSNGWAVFQKNLRSSPEMLMKVSPPEDAGTSLSFGSLPKDLNDPDAIVRWLALEKARSQLRLLPAKENDQADWSTGELEVDPFSVVIFSDIAPFLLPIESAQGKEILLDLFLKVLGFPGSRRIENTEDSIDRSIVHTPRFWPSNLSTQDQGSSWQVIEGEAMQRVKSSALSDPFLMPVKTWLPRLDEMFPIQYDKGKPWFATWGSFTVSKERIKIAKTLLEQLNHSPTSIALTRLALSECTQTRKATSKLAKQLLSQDRSNTTLWRAFARLERNNGNIESARTVYRSLLVVEAPHSSNSLSPVWSEWAELEWEAAEHATSLRILIVAASVSFGSADQSQLATLQQASSTLEILRSRRIFDQLLLLPDLSASLVFCAALFRYLTQEVDEAFESAMEVFDSAIVANQGRDCIEEIAMTHCKFLWRHISSDSSTRRGRLYIPRKITALLSAYVLEYPHNSAFVALLAAFEMTTKVENILRRVLEDKMQRLKDTSSEQDWLVYLYCELHMNLHSVNENAVTRLFERALQARSTSSLLWQLYLQFEVHICQRKVSTAMQSRARMQENPSSRESLRDTIKSNDRQSKDALSRTKSVFYRAIQKVPYCKDLYMTAFIHPLRDAFPVEELLQLSSIMQEKDLRLHTDLISFITPIDGDTDDLQ